MMGIYHACDTIEAETIKFVFIHPKSQIAQKESEHLVVGVVEESTVPQLVPTFGTFMEIEVICAIKLVKAIKDILRCVAVDDVQ
jgi:hypothetical protein